MLLNEFCHLALFMCHQLHKQYGHGIKIPTGLFIALSATILATW